MDRDGFDELGAKEVAGGVWRWVAFHPEWKQEVACAAVESGGRLVLIDPQLPAGRAGRAALQRLKAGVEDEHPMDIVLTVFYHERSAGDIAAAAPGTTLWVVEEGVAKVESTVTSPFRPGDVLPAGLAALPTARVDEVVLWDGTSKTLFVGDVILGRGAEGIELCPESWLPDGVGADDLIRSLMPILDLPVERVLPGHGEPILEKAHARLKSLLGAGA